VRGADVDQAGLFTTGNDFDGKTQGLFGQRQKLAAFLATRSVLVATTRTAPLSRPPKRSPKSTQGIERPAWARNIEALVGCQAGSEATGSFMESRV
jgi:hypothetical protein